MDGVATKLAVGGAAAASVATVGAPAYMILQSKEEEEESKAKTPKKTSRRFDISEEVRRQKIDALISSSSAGAEANTDQKQIDNFLKEFPNCEVLFKKDGDVKAFYEWNETDFSGLGDVISGSTGSEVKSLCEKGIDPIFEFYGGSSYTLLNEDMAN